MYHQNVQCLRNKTDQLEIEFNENNIDIACLSETWLTSCELNVVNIKGYSSKSIFCRNIHKNGGVMILYRSSLNMNIAEIKHISNYSKEKDIEVAGIEIELGNQKIKIVNIYRSPTGD